METKYFKENQNLNDKVQTYLSKKPEWWISTLRIVGLKPKSPIENSQLLLQEVAKYGSTLEKALDHMESKYGDLKETMNTTIKTLDATNSGLEEQLNNLKSEFQTYKTKVEAGILLEGKDAEIYKKFKEQVDLMQGLGKDMEKGFHKAYENAESYFNKAWEIIFGKPKKKGDAEA